MEEKEGEEDEVGVTTSLGSALRSKDNFSHRVKLPKLNLSIPEMNDRAKQKRFISDNSE